MSLKTLEDEQAYIDAFKRSNAWFSDEHTVKLTHEKVDQLLRFAYRAGYRAGEKASPISVADMLFGKKPL